VVNTLHFRSCLSLETMSARLSLLPRNLLRGRHRGAPLSTLSGIGLQRQLATVSASAPTNPLSKPVQEVTSDLTSASTLPSAWFRSDNEKFARLERRAIYSKSWVMAGVISEFTKPGDYKVVDVAGLSVFLVLGRDGVLRGFHNVCRHRAYPLRTAETGCSGVISCGYHAWTWDLNGNLIKAPQFDGVDGFDKTKNSLYPIHVHTTKSGCVFVNLEASDVPSVSFEDFFPGLEVLLDRYDLKAFELRKTLDVVVDCNWKTRIDGFQECYHCQVAHPSLAKTFDIKNYSVFNKANYSQHVALPSSTSVKDAYGNSDALFLYLFPSGAINVFGNAWQWSWTSPMDAGRCRVYKAYYVDPSLSEDEKDAFIESFYDVFVEDVALCEKTQKSLDAGIYTRGILHPTHESGVVAYQERARQLVLQHFALEESLGREVNPAIRDSITETPEDRLSVRLEQREW